ncbi:PREDICTED: dynein heavy chain 1, axonemal-like [Trachymyrmex cornetzi]|uniref:dynein heavy chain 1, axonemal-like n=1 Tax=Trachymyrmex cornetzi TaxID=471704 RepID=UPI00084EECB6|nr:PREDICTED: dynein heavy chain 1, axonemal-like [Trachymyrmex cornetzi]
MDIKNIKDKNTRSSRRNYYSDIMLGIKPVGLPSASRRTNLASQILTEQYSPIVEGLKVQRTQIFLGAAERWITFPEDKSIAFPAETFLPKVQMAYTDDSKIPPHNIEMERKRKIYKNLKIEDALKAENIKPYDILPFEKICPLLSDKEKYSLYSKTSYLPLELFDDEEYDCRTTEEWINLGIIDGIRYPLPATVFVERIIDKKKIFDRYNILNNLYGWFHAAVTDYNNEQKLWTVLTLDGLKRKFLLPRIYIRFFGEDPRKFAKRVAAAVKQRQIAETSIRYHFYLDCMLVEGIPTLDEKQQEVIILLTTRKDFVKSESKHLFNLIDEVVLEYRRVMCDLMWRSLIWEQPEMFNFISWNEINDIHELKIPEMGKFGTEMEDFTKTKNFFCWTILYVLPEIYEAMSCVIVECSNILNMNLFVSNYGKSMYLLEFESQQQQETNTVIKYLKEMWLERIIQSVRLCLRDIGKEWFDLEQKNHDEYNMMKLKRFMTLITYRMQDALRDLVKKSMALYLEILETPALCTLNVDENFVWGNDLINTHFKSSVNPIFIIDIAMNDKTAYYLTDLESFVEIIIAILDNSLRQCQQIGKVHPFLLPFLKFPKDLYLSSVDLLEKQVCEVRERLRTAYQKSTIPLKAYVKEYQQYLEFYKLDVEKYVENFKKADHTIVEIRDEVSFHFKMKSILELALPKDIAIGPFYVNVRPLRDFLIQKRQNCYTQLLIMFTESLRTKIDVVLSDYVQIRTRLRTTLRNIEHLFEEQDWIETVPLRVKKLDEIVQKLKFQYDILDHFWWNLSDGDFEIKWQAIGFPRQVQLYMEEAKNRFVSEYEKFHKVQVQEEILLSERIDTLMGNVINVTLQTDIKKIHEMAVEVKRILKIMKECQEFGLLLNERQKLFGMDVVPYEQLNTLIKEFEPYQTLWIAASNWLKWQEIWMENPLVSFDANQIENMTADTHKAISRCVKVFQENPKMIAIAVTVKNQIEAFKPYISVIQALRCPGMKNRHFEELNKKIGIQMALTPTLSFKNLLILNVMKHKETVKTVADTALKEFLIESTLDKMMTDWKTITMDVLPYKDTDKYIMKISDEIITFLDDDLLKTQHLSFNPFKAVFENQIDEWETKLRLVQEVIVLWVEVQKQWMYLEPIFAFEDISQQLPVESRKFNTMERNLERIMGNARDCPYVIITCADKILLSTLKECLLILETIKKDLSDYLETKRMIFPRFFFLSNDELLEIIVQSKDIQAIQPYLKKCFENMEELRFENSDLRITRMYSAEYEEVVLRPTIYPKGNVENWLGQVENAMRNTLREIIGEALEIIDTTPRKEWVYMWPGQVVLCGGQTHWTAHVEESIANNTLPDYYNYMLLHLEELQKLIRGPQTEVQRLMLEAVMTIEIHAKDVLYKLIQERLIDINGFEWISQLRYYWVDNKDLKIHAINAEFPYEYEYLGNNGRLVITPLTDRCYLTLISALYLKFGGALTGPAGTGKTETTKDLAKVFAVQCVVFNCSDQLNFQSMGKFFKGLASTGAWACFDEFNRIDIKVLSVIAQQIMTIQKAQQTRANKFLFEEVELTLKQSCAVFITMNPGYAGRTELPDNLKALFRPIAMMVPNYALIAEISLFSYGFVDAANLARKITTTFKLTSEQLSSQEHYDFGMHAVKTVIVATGNLKREQKDLEEDQICLRALKNFNVPKFLKDDLKLFNDIISDLFPELIEKPVNYGILEAGIRRSIRQMGLEDVDDFVRKVVQLYETTLMRNGLMLVGLTSSGKTKCYKVLKHTCTSLKGQLQPNGKPFTTVITYALNPKAITMRQLYGEYDLDTHEWTDGILPTLIRTDIATADCDKRWYIFDGPVDAVWIENLNTVLDDNKKLCLASGEIMKLLPTQTIMFEVSDLRVASPATVSRCGMVYMEPETVGLQPLIDCWIRSLPMAMNDYIEEITVLTTQLVLPGLKIVRESLQEIVRTVDSAVVQSYINLMNFRIRPMVGREEKAPPSLAFQNIIPDLLSPWAAFATVWGLGATCDYKSRCIFNDWLRRVQKDAKHKIPFPEEGLVFDYRLHDGFTDPIEGQEPIPPKWYKWLDGVLSITVKPKIKYMDIIIPTTDSVRSAALIEYLLTNETNILCVGATGSGKTLTVSVKLSRNMPKKYICDFMTFSARTTAHQTQDLIDTKLDKRRRGIYGPPILKKQVFFIDDLNMPALDTCGAQPPIELIRQFMNFNGWYDKRKIGSFRLIENVNFVAAMGPPGGGRNPITARLLRHFHIIAFPEMQDDAKSHIFKTILDSWMSSIPEFYDLLDDIVDSTLKVFAVIRSEMLPTPNKSHYTFNLRDVNKVFQGILMADAKKILVREKLLLLWYHENIRVFSDRFINDDDKKWFDQLLCDILMKKFHYNVDDIIGKKPLFYNDFCNTVGNYEEIIDIEKMRNILLDYLDSYNDLTTSPMQLIFFEDAINHICRITRILRQPGGNALLLGISGSGRRSLTKLSSHIKEYNCYQIGISKAYTTHDWRDDIKNIMLKAGLQDQPIVFLFSDMHVKCRPENVELNEKVTNDSMLEDLNNILNNGDVPNIYQTDEVDQIYQAMRVPAQEAGLQINRSNLFSVYQKAVKNNFHAVITMSPIEDTFRARIRQFPALVNCCTIDWFCPWPDAALQSIATHFLLDIKDKSISNDILQSIVKICKYIHCSVIDANDRFLKELDRHNYVTPASYLELLSNYGDLLKKKKDELNSSMIRLSTGLNKFANTETEVKDIQEILKRMKLELEQATETTGRIIHEITQDTIEAEKTKVMAMQQEAAILKMKEENKEIRDEAEADLSEVKPMLEAAEASLKALNKRNITEVKAMKRPPVGVLLVIEAICIINNVAPNKLPGKLPGEKILDYWTPGIQMLADPVYFLYTMAHFKKEDITEEIINKLKDYVENPNFQPDKILQVSRACHSLCLWIRAMYNYYFVNKKVAPKMAALEKAEKVLIKTETALADTITRLQEIQEEIEKLQDQLREEEAKKVEIKREKQLCQERIARAVRLILGLSDEQKRWIIMVDNIKMSLKNAVGDILLSSGAIAYLTPFTDTYRQNLLATWYDALGEDVPHTPGCNPILTLGNQMEIRNWHMNGLPKDTLFIENAILVMNSKRWPLFIDPQAQANKWIRNMCKPIGLSIAKMTDKDLLRTIENCVQFGKPCLIENIGTEMEAFLDPILARALFGHAGQPSIKIGENIVSYNFDFRLYLTTRLSNPRYTPDTATKVLIVNFTLTAGGLADQMLSLVTIKERPDLEYERNALIVSSAEMKQDLEEIKDKILYRLTVFEGSIIDDIDLICILETLKTKSEEIKMKMETIELTQTDIDFTRSLYMPVANRAQILFFCIADLQRIDIMYQYSLEWFVVIFNRSISNTKINDNINERIANINENLTFAFFTNVCRSLFEKHKMHFSFLVCARILLDNGTIDPMEWRHFLTTTTPIRKLPNPASEWITARCWQEIQALERLPKFDKFITSFQLSLRQFKNIFDTQEAHLAPFPQPWETKLDDFEKLLVLKCLRPDKIINAIQIYLTKYLGQQFVEPQTTELLAIYEESSNTTPIVFILSPGTDPAAELYKFAEKLKMDRKLYSISLGQGQKFRAQAMLKKSAEMGTWLFFQNCHLVPSWMPKLKFMIETLSPEKTHHNFRLWLTSAPSPDFPISILQNSSKMTIESPRGVKANMLRTYLTQVTEIQEFLQSDHLKALSFKRLIFSLCMFHSILIERRKFGPLGFNISYDFTNGDLAICLSQLHMFLMKYNTLPFKVLIYTAGHINYGGRITDDWDRRCVLTLLEDYYNANVISQDYQFDEKEFYHQLPAAATFKDYLEYIKDFPLNDNPSLFGMHSNADISYAQAEAHACLTTLLKMQPRELGVAATSVEEVTTQITKNMIATMPESFDLIAMQARYPMSYEESFNTVLLQEAKRYNDLLEIVQSTLQDLLKALKGLVVMSEQLEMIATSFFNNKIPVNWQSKSYPSLKSLAGWFVDLRERIKFISNWRDQGIPPAFWLSGFYFPQAFLIGTLQNFARKYVLSIDTIDFSYKILTSKPTQRPLNGCVIYGLFLEGCRWDGKYLVESLPNELFTDMPPILVLPEVHHVIAPYKIYVCPVYKTIERSGTLSTTGHSSNFVLAIEIPTDKPQSHWIKRGVALICTLDY